MASDTSTGAYWLGLSDAHQEGTWVWQTSLAEALYTNWFPQNPHIDTKRNCAQISMGMDIDGKIGMIFLVKSTETQLLDGAFMQFVKLSFSNKQ